MRTFLNSTPLPRQLFWQLVVALPLLGSCSGNGSNTDAVDAATAQNEKKIDTADITKKQEADADFLVKSTSNALLEVELGKLAQARATAPAVRSYGARLVPQRLALLASLRALAAAKGLTVPAALGGDEQEAYHEASSQPGTQLDKHLMALLVKAQKQDEDNFDDMSDDAYDGDIRGFAAKFHGPVEEQLDAAKEAADVADKLP
jgi:putative membrane protein